jgi:hypothetical protein
MRDVIINPSLVPRPWFPPRTARRGLSLPTAAHMPFQTQRFVLLAGLAVLLGRDGPDGHDRALPPERLLLSCSPCQLGGNHLVCRLPEDNKASQVYHGPGRLLLLGRDQMCRCDTVSLAHPASFVRNVIINPSLFPFGKRNPKVI